VISRTSSKNHEARFASATALQSCNNAKANFPVVIEDKQ